MKSPGDLLSWRIPRHFGKMAYVLLHRGRGHVKGYDKAFVFPRSAVESGDFSQVRAAFSLKRPPKDLPKMIGRVTFAFAGYDQYAEELCEIESVRNYVAEIDRHWPLWLAFCRPDELRLFILCGLSRLTMIRRSEREVFYASMMQADVAAMYLNAVPLAHAFYLKAGIPPEGFAGRLRKAARLLSLG